MARMARLVVPGFPHHITQRGNGRQKVFFSDEDYVLFRELLAQNCRAAGVACWAYCLMPNHIHAILVPSDEDSLRAVLAPTHRRYAGIINARRKRTGHFWQGRYGAAVMDEPHLLAAFCYILRNPVTAKLTSTLEDWPWSSARVYLRGTRDGLTTPGPMRERYPKLKTLLREGCDGENDRKVRDDETIGRPHGDARFIASLERKTGRRLSPGKRGPKPLETNEKEKRKS